jgi:molybdopterin/thiamine biosynthesis adenylyltransferase
MTDPKHPQYSYEEAFSRNIGWVTDWEQQILRSKRIAISGMGGVGGVHLLTLARMGFQNFNIADFDTFELANFNRQLGAFVSTLGQPKTDTLTKIAKDINPGIQITAFNNGITEENIDDFLKDADLYVDGLDFYVLDIRRKIFNRCHELKIPAITAAPLGMGVSYLAFDPHGMSFQEYFGFTNDPDLNQLKFLIGLNPMARHRTYLVDPTKINMKEKRAPSTIMGCTFSAGVVATEAVKILLKRGKVFYAPWYQSFDPFLNQYHRGYLSGGSRNLLNQLQVKAFKVFLAKNLKNIPAAPIEQTLFKNDMERILDVAKWTPSGDNSQPWYFEIKGETEIDFRLDDEGSIYDYSGIPSLWTIGFFIETFQIAAQQFGYDTKWTYERLADKKHVAHIQIVKNTELKNHNLFPFIKIRTTNRYPYSLKPLTANEKLILEDSVGSDFRIRWYESFSERFRITELSALGTYIRMSVKEAYKTHRHIVDFENTFSPNKIPIKAVGVSTMVQKIMKYQLQDYRRVKTMNSLMGTAIISQFEISYLPGMFCAASYSIEWRNPKKSYQPQDLIHAGAASQRFALTCTKLGLSMQPNIAPLAIAYYAKNNIAFTADRGMQKKAQRLSKIIEGIAPVEDIVFLGRVGTPFSKFIASRSIRKTLPELTKS